MQLHSSGDDGQGKEIKNSYTENTHTTDILQRAISNNYADNNILTGTNNDQHVSNTNLDPKKLFSNPTCSKDVASGLGSKLDLNVGHDTTQLQQQQYTEEIHQLIHERDVARNEAEVSKEILSCVMEAVQILTTQMKKSHFELMNNHLTSSNVAAASQKTQTVPGITSMVSDLSGDFSRTKTDSIDEGVEVEEEEEIENGEENYSMKNNHYSRASSVSFHIQDTRAFKNYNYDDKMSQKSVDLPLSLHNADDNYDQNSHSKYHRPTKNMSKNEFSSKSSVASSSVATYMSEENKRFSELLELTSISSTNHPAELSSYHELLSRIQSGLISLGHSCQMVGDNTNMLHNEESTFLIDLQNANRKLDELQNKYRKTEKVAKKLYRENKKLRIELERSKTKKKIVVKELKTLMDEKEVRKEYEAHLLTAWDIHQKMINLPKKMSPTEVNKMYSDDYECPETPFCHVSTSPGVVPPSSSSVGFEGMIENCPTTDSCSHDRIARNTKTTITSASKPSWLSFVPALQLTPTASMVDVSDKNMKPTISSNDLHQSDDDDYTDFGTSIHDQNKNVTSSSSSNSSNPTPKHQTTLKNMFFSSKKTSDKDMDTTVTATDKNTDSTMPKTAIITVQLPAPIKVIKPKRKYKPYKIGE